MKRVFGHELKVGDTIEVWWHSCNQPIPNQDTITKLVPYKGPIVFSNGAQLADFRYNRVGMTINNGELYNLID